MNVQEVKDYLQKTYPDDADEIIDLIGEGIFEDGSYYDLVKGFKAFKEIDDDNKNRIWSDIISDGNLTVEMMEHFGGEGMGDEYWGVAKMTLNDEDVYVRISGWYASYDGCHCESPENWDEVKPVEKMVTVWASV